ncbi:MAG: ATPase RavA [Planctomycetes bacterium]|nr:ATPase RavA [Planctomycetota bacterium]
MLDLVERDVPIRLALLAALAGEHLLLLGPPGTAKSLVARRLQLALADATYFERLLTRFTVPEELFGPLSIKGLEQDRYERLTSSYLPTASIAFLDEIFKANSAILNALLMLLNEREFDNGARRERTPLVAVVGASNEVPEGPELDALFDRFLLRLHVAPVSQSAFDSLLALRGQASPSVAPDLRLTAADVERVRTEAEGVVVPEDVVATLKALREWCVAEHIAVSDRRWRKILKLLQVSAFTNGRDRASIWDCWLLQFCIGDSPEQADKVFGWYASRVGASAAMDPARLTRIVVAKEAGLKSDQDSRSQARDKRGRLVFIDKTGKRTVAARGEVRMRRKGIDLYLAPDGAHVQSQRGYHGSYEPVTDRSRGGKGYTADELNELHIGNHYDRTQFKDWPKRAAYLAAPNNWMFVEGDLAPLMEPTRHKSIYVDGSLKDVDELASNVGEYRNQLAAHVESLKREVESHLWVLAAFTGPATQHLAKTQAEVEKLEARVAALRQGYEMLPREPDYGPSEDEEHADEADEAEEPDSAEGQ